MNHATYAASSLANASRRNETRIARVHSFFIERMNRSIGVHPAYIRTALEKVYYAKSLLAEIDAR